MRTMRSTLSRSPTAACSVPSRSIATARAAFLPVAVVHVAAELADPGLAVALGDVAGEEDEVAGAHEGHVGAGRDRERRQGDVEVGEAVVDRGHEVRSLAERGGARKSYTARDGEHPAPAGVWRRCALAWLAGVALQLQQRALRPAPVYVALLRRRPGLLAVAACALARASSWRALVGAALLAAGRRGGLARRAAPRRALAPALEGRDLVVTGVVASLPQRRRRPGCASASRSRRASRRRAGARCRSCSRSAGTRASTRTRRSAAAARRCAPASAGASRCACAGRTATSTRTASTTSCSCSSRACARPATCATRRRGAARPRGRLIRSSGCASACATRSTRSVADRRAAGVLAALAVGDQGAIERDDWDLFRNTGVAHLMSISGLHVTMFAWLAGARRRRALWRRSARAMLRAAGAAARRAGAASPRRPRYAVFSGWGVPSQRTVWMLATVDAAAGRRAALAVAAGAARRRGRRHARSTRGR